MGEGNEGSRGLVIVLLTVAVVARWVSTPLLRSSRSPRLNIGPGPLSEQPPALRLQPQLQRSRPGGGEAISAVQAVGRAASDVEAKPERHRNESTDGDKDF